MNKEVWKLQLHNNEFLPPDQMLSAANSKHKQSVSLAILIWRFMIIYTFLQVKIDLSWALLDPSSLQEFIPYHRILPSRFWPNRSKLSLLKSRAVIPVFVFSSQDPQLHHLMVSIAKTFPWPPHLQSVLHRLWGPAHHVLSSSSQPPALKLPWIHSTILLNSLCSPLLSLQQILMWLKPHHEDMGLWMAGFWRRPFLPDQVIRSRHLPQSLPYWWSC